MPETSPRRDGDAAASVGAANDARSVQSRA